MGNYTAKKMATANAALWGPAREISPDEIPPKAGKWGGLISDAKLRLEQTSRGRSLMWPITKVADVKHAIKALQKARSFLDTREIRIEGREYEESGAVFITVVGSGVDTTKPE